MEELMELYDIYCQYNDDRFDFDTQDFLINAIENGVI